MRNVGLDEAQAGMKIAGRNINNLRYADDTTLMAESEELKSLLMKVKEESEKVGEDHGIWSHHFMANRWRNSGSSGRICFVEFTPRLHVLLKNLWGRKWSPCPIPPPS